MMHLLGLHLPGVSTSARDVTFFSDYRGTGMYEKRLKALLSKAGSFWRQASDEVIRVGSHAELRLPELRQLRKLLNEDLAADALPGVSMLEEVLKLHAELTGRVRDVDLEAQTEALVTILKSATSTIIKVEDAKGIPAGLVDAMLAGIGKFSDIPGMVTCSSNLQAWVAKHRSAVALTDLIAAMGQSTREAIDRPQIIMLLEKVDPSPAEVENMRAAAEMFLAHAMRNLLDKADWWVLVESRYSKVSQLVFM